MSFERERDMELVGNWNLHSFSSSHSSILFIEDTHTGDYQVWGFGRNSNVIKALPLLFKNSIF